MKKFIQYLIITFSLAIANTGHASSTAAASMKQFSAEQLLKFSKKVEKAVAAKGARVFIIGRVGRPAKELPKGFHFTHTAFGVYSIIQTADGRKIPGYVMYNLYQRDKQPDVSDLVKDYPVDFFSGVHALKAGIVIPKPELQARLLKVIQSSLYKELHNARYSAISNPFNQKYQNCTEHTLDVINAAIYKTDDIRQLKKNSSAYFKAQKVKVNPFKLLAGSLFKADIATSDHDDVIQTATFSTIKNYLQQNKLVSEQFVITAN